MPEFSFTRVFTLEEGSTNKLHVSVTHENATGKFLDVTFSDPDRDQMVSVPADLLDRVLAAVQAGREF